MFEIDVLVGPHCGAARKPIAGSPSQRRKGVVAIRCERRTGAYLSDGRIVRTILTHLGLETEPPRLAPARAPPEAEFAW